MIDGVLVGDQVDHQRVAALEGVHVVEAEERVGLVAPAQRAGLAVDHLEARALLGLPLVVLDERLAGEGDLERVHAQRVLGQDQVAPAHAERVHVGRPLDRQARDHAPLRRVRGQAVEHVLALAREARDVVHELVALGVVMGMGGGHVALDPVAVVEVAERLERLGVELDRQRRLGHGDVALADAGQVHVRVVGGFGREDRLHALEQRAAGVGAEAAGQAALLGLGVGVAADEAALVGDLPVGEAEAVEHGQAVEPVVDPPLAHLELGGRHAHERAAEPGGQRAAHGQALHRRLLLEALEAELVVRRGRLRQCRCHGQDCTVYSGLMQELTAHPDLLRRAGLPELARGRRHALRAQGDGGPLGRLLLDAPARPALHRARASGARRAT